MQVVLVLRHGHGHDVHPHRAEVAGDHRVDPLRLGQGGAGRAGRVEELQRLPVVSRQAEELAGPARVDVVAPRLLVADAEGRGDEVVGQAGALEEDVAAGDARAVHRVRDRLAQVLRAHARVVQVHAHVEHAQGVPGQHLGAGLDEGAQLAGGDDVDHVRRAAPQLPQAHGGPTPRLHGHRVRRRIGAAVAGAGDQDRRARGARVGARELGGLRGVGPAVGAGAGGGGDLGAVHVDRAVPRGRRGDREGRRGQRGREVTAGGVQAQPHLELSAGLDAGEGGVRVPGVSAEGRDERGGRGDGPVHGRRGGGPPLDVRDHGGGVARLAVVEHHPGDQVERVEAAAVGLLMPLGEAGRGGAGVRVHAEQRLEDLADQTEGLDVQRAGRVPRQRPRRGADHEQSARARGGRGGGGRRRGRRRAAGHAQAEQAQAPAEEGAASGLHGGLLWQVTSGSGGPGECGRGDSNPHVQDTGT